MNFLLILFFTVLIVTIIYKLHEIENIVSLIHDAYIDSFWKTNFSIKSDRSPTEDDWDPSIGTLWINTKDNLAFLLIEKNNNKAKWVCIAKN